MSDVEQAESVIATPHDVQLAAHVVLGRLDAMAAVAMVPGQMDPGEVLRIRDYLRGVLYEGKKP